MTGNQNSFSSCVAKLSNKGSYFCNTDGIETVDRLIQNQKFRIVHNGKGDGKPLPSFEGEPKLVEIPDDIDAFTELLWSSLNEDNKVSLFTRYIDIATGKYETRIVNKNK